MIKAVLFDMDGTVFDTEAIYRRCWFRAAKDVGFDEDIDLFLHRVCGLNLTDMTAFVYRTYGADAPFEALWGRWLECVDEEMACGILPFKSSAPEIFAEMKKRGIKIALVTSSGQKTVAQYLQMSGMEGVFDVVLTGESVTHGKPHPEVFLIAAERLGVAPAHCVVVEDSPNGVRAGHAAKMFTVMVPDLHPCTEELRALLWQVCDTLTDLIPLIDKENNN
jgi:HAD superfamily hydrolase (TIGR01509 family)